MCGEGEDGNDSLLDNGQTINAIERCRHVPQKQGYDGYDKCLGELFLNGVGMILVVVVCLMVRLHKMESMKTLKHDVLKCIIDTYMILQD